MNLYVETSAVLSWLLDEPDQPRVNQLLRQADLLITSRLTWLECGRSLRRQRAAGRQMDPDLLSDLRREWTSIQLTADILTRAEADFPVEPVRSLDGIHLASALAARDWVADLELASLDARVRANAVALGFVVLPL